MAWQQSKRPTKRQVDKYRKAAEASKRKRWEASASNTQWVENYGMNVIRHDKENGAMVIRGENGVIVDYWTTRDRFFNRNTRRTEQGHNNLLEALGYKGDM